ncbi:MAG: L-seryl-tRNA(Sec) selenium transferase [Steroidobacteraceae bacterium]
MSTDVTPARAADIPSLDRLLNEADFAPSLTRYSRTQVTAALREALAALRRQAALGELHPQALVPQSIARTVDARLQQETRPRMRTVFNLTGTVLHTNLGRAPLPAAVQQSVLRVLSGPVNLEYDLRNGRRGDRDDMVEPSLRELTGAEAATVVNNNAAAVLLMLHALANRREVVVSRGELVEIGGAFRIPDVMRSAGSKLIEVGTTNRTHTSDYTDAINPRTALLMKVHTSNYAITGFTASVGIGELAAVGRAHGLPLAVDLGSGSLVDLAQWGLPKEPTVREAIAAGADLVAFSGDKLLGGPQAGLIVGRADLIERIKKNPLKRALRVGKLTLAALEAVLGLYRAPELLAEKLTILRLLTRSVPEIASQARRLLPAVQAALGEAFEVAAAPMTSQVGSGALPADRLPSFGLRVDQSHSRRPGLNRLEASLRELPRPIIGRIADRALWLDLRCLEVADEAEFTAQWSAFGR